MFSFTKNYLVWVGSFLQFINKNNHQVRMQHLFWEHIFNSSLRLNVLLDANAEIIAVNEGLVKNLEYLPEQLIGKPFASILAENLRDPKIVEFIFRHGKEKQYETLFQSEKGRLIPVALTITPVKEYKDYLINYIVVAFDISEKQQAQKQLLTYQERLESLVTERTKEFIEAKEKAEHYSRVQGDFIANISHEVRTPVHAIMNYAAFGLKNEKKPIKQCEYFQRIKVSAERLLQLLNDMLDFEKLRNNTSSLNFQQISIIDLIEKLIQEQAAVAEQRNLKLRLIGTHKEFLITCDEIKIGQVVNNLINNAIKFSEENSTITIQIESYEECGNKMLKCIVTNIGIPIPTSELTVIFDQFVQSTATSQKIKGTGLGLAICRYIIEAHQGRIWAENSDDGKTNINFVIPFHHLSANNV